MCLRICVYCRLYALLHVFQRTKDSVHKLSLWTDAVLKMSNVIQLRVDGRRVKFNFMSSYNDNAHAVQCPGVSSAHPTTSPLTLNVGASRGFSGNSELCGSRSNLIENISHGVTCFDSSDIIQQSQ